MKQVFTIAAFSLTFAAAGGVNLLNNPGFAADAGGFPLDWSFRRERNAEYVSAADGVLTVDTRSDAVSFKQSDIHLVPGRRYRFGADVRTRGTGARARLVVFNYAWTKDASLDLPGDTEGAWTRIEGEFTAPPSRDELYSFAVYCAKGAKRAFAVRAPFLVPASGAIDGEEKAPLFSSRTDRGVPAVPPPAPADGTRLNTMVRRLLAVDARDGHEAAFTVSREGWVWVARDGTDGTIALDGADAGALATDDGRLEAMRFVGKGVHRLKVAGFTGTRRLVVHAVPSILATSYPEPKIPGAERFTGGFLDRYLYPAFNTFSYGWSPSRLPAAEWTKLAARGRLMFGHLCRWNKNVRGYVNRMEPSGHLAARFRATNGMRHPRYAGLTFDEISASALLEKTAFTGALRLSRDLPRPLWVWSSGVVYEDNPVNADYLSSIVDASGGRGRLLFECYAHTQKDERSALVYLDDFLDGSIRRAEKMVPGFVRSSMIVQGAYTRPGGYCTDCYADVDVKRFWDLYFHRLATGAAFEGLAGIGLYAIANSEEEDLRWASRIIRHYAIEGRTDLLSDRYGFRYRPGHLSNGDFADGLAGWTAVPAETGSVAAADVKGFAALQSRRTPGSGGNTACVFRRCASRPNVLRRTLTGLVPGRLYSLRFVLAPRAEIASRKGATRTLAFTAGIAGADDVTAASPVGTRGGSARAVGVLNTRLVIFKANAPTAELTFTDWADASAPGGPVGEELALNFVRVTPYYEK